MAKQGRPRTEESQTAKVVVGLRVTPEWNDLLTEMALFTHYGSRVLFITACVRNATRLMVEYAIETGKCPRNGPGGDPIDLQSDTDLLAAVRTMRRMRPAGKEQTTDAVDLLPKANANVVEA